MTLGQEKAAVLDSSERKPSGKGKVAVLFLTQSLAQGLVLDKYRGLGRPAPAGRKFETSSLGARKPWSTTRT